MPLKPNRPGALRGPTGQTLQEVVAAVRQARDHLEEIRTIVTGMEAREAALMPLWLQMIQALGLHQEAPAGRSVKYLLNEILTCVCEAATPVESFYTAVAPPVGGCGGGYSDSTYIQTSGWAPLSVAGRLAPTWHPGQGGILVEPATITTTLGHTYNALRRVSGAGNVELCAMWESAVSPAPSIKYQRYNNVGGGVYDSALGIGELNLGTTSGNDEVFLDEDAIVFYVETPTGAASDPLFRIWLKGLGLS